MTIQPTGDNLIIKIEREEEANKTTSGIYIPKAAGQQHRPEQGEVVAVGTGRVLNSGVRIPFEVAVGNHVIFNKFAGTEIESDGELYLIIKENDVLAIIK